MLDISGRGNHASTNGVSLEAGSGNGATTELQYLAGDTTSTVLWPFGSIPAVFTICSATRYTGDSMGTILGAINIDWFHGHNGVKRGVAFYLGRKTNVVSVGVLTDWLVMCGKNKGFRPNNILVDGVASGISNGGGVVTDVLAINIDPWNNGYSDWAFREVMIWDRALSDTDMSVASTALKNSLYDQVCFLFLFGLR